MITPDEPLLTPAEVGDEFRVNPKVVHRWVKEGLLDCVDTKAGRRFRRADVDAAKAAAWEDNNTAQQTLTTADVLTGCAANEVLHLRFARTSSNAG